MPDFAEVHFKHYFLSINGSDGQEYLNRRFINFPPDAFGQLLVKTDQPIYNPSQTGKLLWDIKHSLGTRPFACVRMAW